MSLESFSITSLSESFLVKLMAENLEKTVHYKYPYQRCIAVIELTFRPEYKERIYHEFNQLPVKSTSYDEEQQKFVDNGRILIRTDHFDFTINQHSHLSFRVKKHPINNTHSLPFEEEDASRISEGLIAHYIKIPKTLETDLMKNITKGKKGQLCEVVSYPPEEGLMASITDKVNHSIWGFFRKTQ